MSSGHTFGRLQPDHTSDPSGLYDDEQPHNGARRLASRRLPASLPSTDPLQAPVRRSSRQRYLPPWHDLFTQLSDIRTERGDTPHPRDPTTLDNHDPPNASIFQRMPQVASSSPRSQEHHEETRRVKRRKLDSDRLQLGSFKGFRYGKYGQMESGKLEMEIVSCDGGTFQVGASYGAENILKDDKSVYCTKANMCNIILRHQGGTAFSLDALVIKAPGVYNYSAPVQEGMVFVSMNSDDLLSRTAEYRIQYAQSRSRSRSPNSDDQPMATGSRSRGRDTQVDGASIRRALREARRYVHGVDDWDDRDEDLEGHNSGEGRRAARWGQEVRMPQEFTKTLSSVRVTTECDYNSDDEEQTGLRPPDRIGSLPFESAGSAEVDTFETYNFLQGIIDAGPRGRSDAMLSALAASWNRDPLGRNGPRPVARAEEGDRGGGSGGSGGSGGGGGGGDGDGSGARLMMPHAKFHVDKEKSKCTIRFDPPVSGRYVLLKMWNPNGDATSNIDIKAVVAKGYAGPRYFPSVQWR